MLFSIVAFTACDTTNADLLARIEALEQERQVIATLTQRIEALEAQNKILQGIIDDLQNGAVYSEKQIELLQDQIEALQDFVEELIEQIEDLIESADYINANLLALIEALQGQVEGLQETVERLEKEVKFLTSTINMPDMVIENAYGVNRYGQSWDIGRNSFAGLEVSIYIPQRVIRTSPQGFFNVGVSDISSFRIIATVTNISNEPRRMVGTGRFISIAYMTSQLVPDAYIWSFDFGSGMPIRYPIFYLEPGESLEDIFNIRNLWNLYEDIGGGLLQIKLPEGLYDIYFSNGIVFRNAFKII